MLQLQQQRNQDSNWNGSDLISIDFLFNENSSNRDGQGAKLLEILLEPLFLLVMNILSTVWVFDHLNKHREQEQVEKDHKSYGPSDGRASGSDR